MTTKLIQKNVCLMDGTKIKVDISIPLRSESVLDESQEEWVMEMLNNQVIRGLTSSIDAYKNSELPNRFLYPQNYTITNSMPADALGAFCLRGDDIFIDADAISNIGRISSSFLLGHEMGHKIEKYTDPTEAFWAIASAFGMGIQDNEEFLREMYADICGIIVSQNNDASLAHLGGYSLNEVFSNDHTEHLKRRVLSNIYHV